MALVPFDFTCSLRYEHFIVHCSKRFAAGHSVACGLASEVSSFKESLKSPCKDSETKRKGEPLKPKDKIQVAAENRKYQRSFYYALGLSSSQRRKSQSRRTQCKTRAALCKTMEHLLKVAGRNRSCGPHCETISSSTNTYSAQTPLTPISRGPTVFACLRVCICVFVCLQRSGASARLLCVLSCV